MDDPHRSSSPNAHHAHSRCCWRRGGASFGTTVIWGLFLYPRDDSVILVTADQTDRRTNESGQIAKRKCRTKTQLLCCLVSTYPTVGGDMHVAITVKVRFRLVSTCGGSLMHIIYLSGFHTCVVACAHPHPAEDVEIFYCKDNDEHAQRKGQ